MQYTYRDLKFVVYMDEECAVYLQGFEVCSIHGCGVCSIQVYGVCSIQGCRVFSIPGFVQGVCYNSGLTPSATQASVFKQESLHGNRSNCIA